METFKFSDLVDYSKLQQGTAQALCFDITTEFVDRLSACLVGFEQEHAGEDMLMTEYLTQITARIESQIGPMTVPQILAVVHSIACRIGGSTSYGDGYEDGYKEGYGQFTERFSGSALGAKNRNQATA